MELKPVAKSYYKISNMKVLHVININAVGGAEKLLIDFLPALEKDGAEISCAILCPSKWNNAALTIRAKLQKRGINVYLREYDFLFSITNFKWLLKVCRECKATLVHTHLRYADIWITALKALGFLKCLVVSTIHGYNDEYMNKHGLHVSRGIRFTFYYWVTRWVARKADGLIFISNCMRSFYERCHFTKKGGGVVIYHGYCDDKSVLLSDKTRRTDSELKLVLPGRVVERKGHKYALDALLFLKRKKKNVSLHFLGDGPNTDKLKGEIHKLKIEKDVYFHGYKDNILLELAKYDIVVLPSLWEPFGLVFLDAFAARVPVVAFDLPAGNEIIRNGESGILVSPFSGKALAENILRLWQNTDLYNQLIKGGVQEIETRFSINVMINKYWEFYLLLTSKENL